MNENSITVEVINRKMNKMENEITAALEAIKSYIEAHDGYAELGEVNGNRVIIYCGGRCADCEPKCIEDAIKDKVPGIEIIFR